MPAGSKNKRFSFIDERTHIALWVKWQALRRHPEYGHAVQTCLQEVTEQLNTLCLSLSSSTSDLITCEFPKGYCQILLGYSELPHGYCQPLTHPQQSDLSYGV